MPSGFHLTVDTLPSGSLFATGQRGITPAFGYSAPHPSASGTLTHLIWALPSAHYGPLRLPTVNAERVIDSPPAISLRRNPFASGITSDLPGSFADLSTRALPNHPEQSDRFKCPLIPHQWQASPDLGGWPLLFEINEAETGALALGSRLRRQRGPPSLSPQGLLPLEPANYPHQVTQI